MQFNAIVQVSFPCSTSRTARTWPTVMRAPVASSQDGPGQDGRGPSVAKPFSHPADFARSSGDALRQDPDSGGPSYTALYPPCGGCPTQPYPVRDGPTGAMRYSPMASTQDVRGKARTVAALWLQRSLRRWLVARSTQTQATMAPHVHCRWWERPSVGTWLRRLNMDLAMLQTPRPQLE